VPDESVGPLSPEPAPEPTSKPASARASSRLGTIVLLVLILLATGSARLRLLDLPLERDEGEYAYAGQLMLQGIPPYQLAYNMKLPGTYAMYALFLGAFGQTPRGIHLGLLLVNLATIALVFAVARRWFGSLAGVTAASAYALLSVSPSVLGLAAHATHFVVLFGVGGTLLLILAEERDRGWIYVLAGIAMGLAFVMKQQGVVFLLFGFLITLLAGWRHDAEGGSRALLHSRLFLLGALLPAGLTGLWLWRAGVFEKFWFWCVTYAREYATAVPLGRGIQEFAFEFPRALQGHVLLWLCGVAGAWAVWTRPGGRAPAVRVTALLVASLLGVSLGLYFRAHYFILMLPVLAILAGAAMSSLAEALGRRGVPPAVPWAAPLVILSLATGEALLQHGRTLFRDSPFEVTRATYGTNPFPEALEVARYIAKHSKPSDRIAVLGSEPEIYFYAHRHSATGYVYAYGPMEEQPYALQMQREMIAEIEAARPEYVVFVRVPASWLVQPKSQMLLLEWTLRYTQSYELVGTADILADRSVYRWKGEPESSSAKSPFALLLFRRRSA